MPSSSPNLPKSPHIITMAPSDRSRGRTVHIYDANNPTTVIGGLIVTNGITNTSFYSMVEILVSFPPTFELHHENGATIQRNDEPLQPGKYYIHADGSVVINDEPWLVRTTSRVTGTRVQSFCRNVQERGRRCVVSGLRAPGAHVDYWVGWEAAHIFPLAYEDHWRSNGYDCWITVPPASGGSINSIQNGMLLSSTLHQLFDDYSFSVNPDDNYKIVFFTWDVFNLAGKYMDLEFVNDPQRPVDQLLRWHFRQAVLGSWLGEV